MSEASPAPTPGSSDEDGAACLAEGLRLIELGIALLVLHPVLTGGACGCGRAECPDPGKHPIEARWQSNPIRDGARLEALYVEHPRAGIGVVTGSASGLFIIDVDEDKGGLATLSALKDEHAPWPSSGPCVLTSRGFHLYFSRGDLLVRNSAGARGNGLGEGIDVRGEGGYCVLPPSRHASGIVYEWLIDGEGVVYQLGTMPLAAAPPSLAQRLVKGKPERERNVMPLPIEGGAHADRNSGERAGGGGASIHRARDRSVSAHPGGRGAAGRAEQWALTALTRECEAVRSTEPGSRNETLNRAAFNLGTIVAGGHLDELHVRGELVDAATANGLSLFEAQKTARSGLAAGMKAEPREAPPDREGYAMPSPPPMPSRPMGEGEPEGPDELSVTSLGAGAGGGGEGAAESGEREARGGGARVPDLMQPRFTTARLFAPLPPHQWTVPGLQLGAGRPSLIAGYGASAKTLMAQSLAISLAAGRPIWQRFDPGRAGHVLHVDYEQTLYASAKRYQRLALGHGIEPGELDDRIHYIELPHIFIDQRGALEQYQRACEGMDLVIIDALRGAAPHGDENDSKYRNGIDLLTRVSQGCGCCVLVLHHAGKPKEEHGTDGRTLARGSSAIYDAAGCVFNVVATQGSRVVTQVKQPAEAEGATLEPFELVVEDTPGSELLGLPSGVRVRWQPLTQVDELERAEKLYRRDAERILECLKRHGGGSSNAIVTRVGMTRARCLDVLVAMSEEGLLTVSHGKNRSKSYALPSAEEPSDERG